MQIEIYLPCEPEYLCNGILAVVAVALVVGLLLFIGVVWREYLAIKRPKPPPRDLSRHRDERSSVRDKKPPHR